MQIKKIDYPTDLNKIKDITNDNIDVFVELENGHTYTLTISTPQNYYWYMEKEGLDYIPASPPDIIVKELKEDIIEKALKNFCEDDAYFLIKYAEM